MIDTVGIVGGGIMGCLTALALAHAGKRVVLFERKDQLMGGASRGNEGKVHLGFTYGLDRTGATRSVMMRYGRQFEAALSGLVDVSAGRLFLHRRQYYAVHRDSSLADDGVARHMHAISSALSDGASGSPVDAMVRQLSHAERRAQFTDSIRDVWEVPEGTVDCVALGRLVDAAVRAEAHIELRLETRVGFISDEDRPSIHGASGLVLGQFDRVVNAAWDDMPRIEKQALAAMPDYCLRAKAGFIARVTGGEPAMPVTTVYGSFGDIVPQGDGTAYISWYPACLMGFTTEIEGGDAWYDRLAQRFDYDRAFRECVAAFVEMIPELTVEPQPVRRLGGPILAVAVTDIPDLSSRLHERTHFGFHRRGNVVAVDTGKLTCGPGLALELRDMLLG